MNTFLTSSIGRKLVMSVTGLFLITFLIVHCTINSMIFFNDGGEAFNKAAHFMGTNILIRTMEIVLFAGLILHIVQAYMLAAKTVRLGLRVMQLAIQVFGIAYQSFLVKQPFGRNDGHCSIGRSANWRQRSTQFISGHDGYFSKSVCNCNLCIRRYFIMLAFNTRISIGISNIGCKP